MRRAKGFSAILAAVLATAPVDFAHAILGGLLKPGIVQATIDDNTVNAEINVLGLTARLTLRFENVVGLSVENLGLSAFLINPLSPNFLARLQAAASIPGALPLVVRIEPPPTGGLSFSGVVEVELYTHLLQYTIDSPLRIYSAPLDGPFTDITTSLSGGSVRSGGTKPDFSEFMFVLELRPLATVIDTKYTHLASLLNEYAGQMSSGLHSELLNLFTASRTAWQSGAPVAAIEYIDAFSAKVRANSGSQLPDVWRSTRDLINVAGGLRAAAGTLRFSLTLASNAS